jgi:hypothetical protein
LPVVALRNGLDRLSWPAFPAFPRISTAAAEWRDVVRRLVAEAHLIVVDCSGLSSGIAQELKIIVEEGRQDSTVVIVESTGGKKGKRRRKDPIDADAELIGKRWYRPPRPSPLSLSRFKRVVSADQVLKRGSDLRDVFGELLSELPENSVSRVTRGQIFLSKQLPWAKDSNETAGEVKCDCSTVRPKTTLMLFLLFGLRPTLRGKLLILDRFPELRTDVADEQLMSSIVGRWAVRDNRLGYKLAAWIALLRRSRVVGLAQAEIEFYSHRSRGATATPVT